MGPSNVSVWMDTNSSQPLAMRIFTNRAAMSENLNDSTCNLPSLSSNSVPAIFSKFIGWDLVEISTSNCRTTVW